MDLLLRPPLRLRAGARRGTAGEAWPGHRPRRPYRRCERGRPAPPLRGEFDGARRALVERDTDQSLSAPCREKGERLEPARSFKTHPKRPDMKISGVDIRPGNII